jgi:pilus assembly protein FimV
VGRAITVAILAAALALALPAAQAAGLGRLTVLSPLGQPLNAEIEIVALRPGEEENLVARVAPREAFAEAGIEPSHVLSTMRFAVQTRDGRRILRMTTQQAVNEPFVEVLIELQWGSGRLVREYTFLLDPPEYGVQGAAGDRSGTAAAGKARGRRRDKAGAADRSKAARASRAGRVRRAVAGPCGSRSVHGAGQARGRAGQTRGADDA